LMHVFMHHGHKRHQHHGSGDSADRQPAAAAASEQFSHRHGDRS
jgi:hypothetical protein